VNMKVGRLSLKYQVAFKSMPARYRHLDGRPRR
jgi:hypothetical protein